MFKPPSTSEGLQAHCHHVLGEQLGDDERDFTAYSQKPLPNGNFIDNVGWGLSGILVLHFNYILTEMWKGFLHLFGEPYHLADVSLSLWIVIPETQ